MLAASSAGTLRQSRVLDCDERSLLLQDLPEPGEISKYERVKGPGGDELPGAGRLG